MGRYPHTRGATVKNQSDTDNTNPRFAALIFSVSNTFEVTCLRHKQAAQPWLAMGQGRAGKGLTLVPLWGWPFLRHFLTLTFFFMFKVYRDCDTFQPCIFFPTKDRKIIFHSDLVG